MSFSFQLLFTNPIVYLIALVALAFGLVLHNVAQALVAANLGDSSATSRGFASTEPRVHLDPFSLIWLALFGFGIPNQIPLNAYHLRGRASGEIFVWFSGPIVLISWGFLLAILEGILRHFIPDGSEMIQTGLRFGGFLVMYLGVFFIFPVPPLDGARAFWATGNRAIRNMISELEKLRQILMPFGLMLIFQVIRFLGLFDLVLNPIVALQGFILSVLGLST